MGSTYRTLVMDDGCIGKVFANAEIKINLIWTKTNLAKAVPDIRDCFQKK
jgi:hypothetical protein